MFHVPTAESHLNFCSIIWGFSAKSNIDLLFTAQKKAIRAIAPGYNSSYYKDGRLPTHTKSFFSSYKLLTVQGIIAKNTVIFMNKITRHSQPLPESVRDTFSPDLPTAYSDHESSASWLAVYGTSIFRSSIFYKGPLLFIDTICNQILPPTACNSPIAFKNFIKSYLIGLQGEGNEEWSDSNFPLLCINGLRRSNRLNE